MNKSAGELNEAFVKGGIHGVPIAQPKRLEHLMSFKEKLPVEQIEKCDIVRVELSSLMRRKKGGQSLAFRVHAKGWPF